MIVGFFNFISFFFFLLKLIILIILINKTLKSVLSCQFQIFCSFELFLKSKVQWNHIFKITNFFLDFIFCSNIKDSLRKSEPNPTIQNSMQQINLARPFEEDLDPDMLKQNLDFSDSKQILGFLKSVSNCAHKILSKRNLEQISSLQE